MLGRLLPRACFRSCQGGVFVSASTLCQCGRLPSSGLRPPRVTTVLNSQRNYARQRYEYKRFGQGQEQDTGRFGRVRRYWITSPAFRIGVGAAAGGSIVFYFANIETVPETGRRRFNFIGPEFMAQQGIQAYQQTMQQYRGRILPDWAPETRLAKKVLDRLIPASGISGEWELHVVNDSNANAFVLPGNKVFVFTGILPICENEDGLATVLGHEIAHNVAQHAAERTSQLAIIFAAATVVSLLFDVSGGSTSLIGDLIFQRPGSRKQESEADHIGLLMMASSCFDPAQALEFWRRMDKAQKFKPPQFLSTHPSEHDRFQKLQQWLPQAEDRRSQSECGYAMDYINPFRGFQDQVKQETFLE